MLSYDTSGNLTEVVSNTLKSNVANYLSNYRMINDYISVETANVIDLAIDVDVILDSSQNQGSIVAKIINIITAYFSPAVRGLGQNVYVSEIRRLIQSENGVISISNILVYNTRWAEIHTIIPFLKCSVISALEITSNRKPFTLLGIF